VPEANGEDDPTLPAPLGAEAAEAAPATPPRDVVVATAIIANRYRLERKLGEGGMGVVWEAVHIVTRRPVALKFLKPDDADLRTAQARFLREARATSAVNHPGLVPIHDVIQLGDGTLCMVMDLLRGESFAARLAREGALPLAEVAGVMLQVASATAAAHAAGVVHRDLKPDNIFLVDEPSGGAIGEGARLRDRQARGARRARAGGASA
jgi:eukaryotic-like serine/threonine-protein kinase